MSIAFSQPITPPIYRPLEDKVAESVSLKDFGAVGDGVTDDTAAFEAFAAYTIAAGCEWMINEGSYFVDPAGPIEFRTGGVCRGELLFRRGNSNAAISFVRDEAGAAVSTTGWSLDRGNVAIGAASAAGKVVSIESNQHLIKRNSSLEPEYLRQEFVKVLSDGTVSRPLVCSYSQPAAGPPPVTLVATAHTPSAPIEVVGLHIRLLPEETGAPGTGSNDGCVRIQRDNVHMVDLTVQVEGSLAPSTGVRVGVSVSFCHAPKFTDPTISGFTFDGLGYGMYLGNTLDYVLMNARISECRHAVTGRHNTDGRIIGGTFGYNVDDHWGENWSIEGATIRCRQGDAGINYAGNNLRVVDCTQFEGRSFVVMRSDTPHLGGTVDIIRPRWYSQEEVSEAYGVFTSYGNYNPVGCFATPPSHPDVLNIDSPTMHVDTPANRWLVYTDEDFTVPHVPLGQVNLTGTADFRGDLVAAGVLIFKNAAAWRSRSPHINVAGRYDFGPGGNIIYVITTDEDDDEAVTARIDGATGTIRYTPLGLRELDVFNSTIAEVENDGAATDVTASSRYVFRGCTFSGGMIDGQTRNAAFFNCLFTAQLPSFPASYSGGVWTSYVTLVGNVSLVAQPAMPDDIVTNIVAPFDAQF